MLFRRRSGSAPGNGRLPRGFGAEAYARLAQRLELGCKAAEDRGRRVVASVTVDIDPAIDALAHIRVASATDNRWCAFAQPAREATVLATLGRALNIQTEGAARFTRLVSDCGEALDGALIDDPFDDARAPHGAGVVWVGGFAFDDSRRGADAWREYPPAALTLPAASFAVRGGEDPQARLTLNVVVEPCGNTVSEMLSEVELLVDSLELDRDLTRVHFEPQEGEVRIAGTSSPEHFEGAVEQAVSEIQLGAYEKVVLAREVTLRREAPIDPFNAFAGLTETFPECTVFALSEAETTFVGASPELLIRREGRRASTIALAGSARRGTDPETDALLGERLTTSAKNRVEHAIVVERIEQTLGRDSAWVSVAKEPQLVKMKNVQHLATPIRAQLTEPRPVVELAGSLHPTPAVGGDPWPETGERIRALEGFDRGWYTGAVGWSDLLEDGEFHVALRSALISGAQARLFAGCGIVASSEPSEELAETETKLAALIPILSLS